MLKKWSIVLLALAVLVALALPALAQETTGGLQGVVKDSSGGLVANAQVVVSSDSLVGTKEAQTDGAGYYHFANLPAGTYTITATAKASEPLSGKAWFLKSATFPRSI